MAAQRYAWVKRTTRFRDGSVHFEMFSRKRANKKEKRHSHLVIWSPHEKVLVCSCPGYAYRRICAGTRTVLAGLAR